MHWKFTPVAVDHMRRNNYEPSDLLGWIPTFVHETDKRSAVEQIDDNYRPIGGGWRDSKGWTITPDGHAIYPGDPPLTLLATTELRDEKILFFAGAWVAVIQPDGTHRMARID